MDIIDIKMMVYIETRDYSAKWCSVSGPSTENCETLYNYVTLSVRVSIIVIPRPTKLVRGINVTWDVRPPPVCISFLEQI